MLETTLSENCQCYFHFFHCSFGSIWKLITVLHCFQIGSPTKQSEHSENSELPDSSKTIIQRNRFHLRLFLSIILS